MVIATEPLVTSPRVELPVPGRLGEPLQDARATMVRALDMAEDGVFLTPLTQPEMQGVRAWLYEQVAAN